MGYSDLAQELYDQVNGPGGLALSGVSARSATGSHARQLAVFRVDDYGADPTGVAVSDAAWTACYADALASVQGSGAGSVGAILELGAGIYNFSINVAKVSDCRIGLRGQGRQVTQITSTGSNGDILYVTDTAATGRVAAPCSGFTVYGWNAGANVNGFHYGDRVGGTLTDIQVWGCIASGSRNYLFRNDNGSSAGCEGTFARLYSSNGGASNVTFDGSNANGTFDYGDWSINCVGGGASQVQNHNQVEFVNQAHMVGGRLHVQGNLSAAATFTSTFLAVGSSASDKAHINQCELHLVSEGDTSAGTLVDITIQGDATFAGGIGGCVGIVNLFNASGTFTAGTITGSVVVGVAGRLNAPFFSSSTNGVLAQMGPTFAVFDHSPSNLKAQIGVNGHIGFLPVVAPTVAAGGSAGTTPPAPTLIGNASDTSGQVQTGTGTTPSAGAQAAVTFGNAYAASPIVVLSPTNSATAALQPYVSSVSTTGFSVSFAVAPAGSQATGVYQVNYHVFARGT